MRTRPEPRCEGLAWLFASVDRRNHEEAKRQCLGTDGELRCPMFTTCEATVADIIAGPHRSGLHGTWAGKLYGQRTHKEST